MREVIVYLVELVPPVRVFPRPKRPSRDVGAVVEVGLRQQDGGHGGGVGRGGRPGARSGGGSGGGGGAGGGQVLPGAGGGGEAVAVAVSYGVVAREAAAAPAARDEVGRHDHLFQPERRVEFLSKRREKNIDWLVLLNKLLQIEVAERYLTFIGFLFVVRLLAV